MRKSDCIYRLTANSEIIKGEFDWDAGVILGVEEYMAAPVLEVSKYFRYFEGNYTSGEFSYSTSMLCDKLIVSKEALLCINYNNIGVLLVSKNYIRLFLDNLNAYTEEYKRDKAVFRLARNVAILKAPVYTLNKAQGLTEIAIFNEDDKWYTLSRYGKLEVDSRMANGVKGSMKLYARMFESNDSTFGMCNIDGTEYVIKKENSKLIVERW